MSVIEFAEDLEQALVSGSIPQDLATEEEFERGFVIPAAVSAVSAFPTVFLYAHPFKRTSKCKPDCKSAMEGHGDRVIGCPDCWSASKSWATVSAYGMRHTFDLIARDDAERTLAVEIKWISFRGRRAPNGEFQRFLGQCGIAASRHDVVLGVCGLRGGPDSRFDEQQSELLEAFRASGVRLLVLEAPEQLDSLEITAS